MVCSEGRNQLATIQPYYNFVSASPISDSRKGCPYEVRGLKFVRILKGERSSPPTVCKTGFSEDFVPLTRQRCVEVAAPYKLHINKIVRISRQIPVCRTDKKEPSFLTAPFTLYILYYLSSVSVAAMTAFIVCMRFSASAKTTDCALSNTSSVTSIESRPNFSPISLPIVVFMS
jgi:hypothetical protein